MRATIRAAMACDGSRTYTGEFRTLLPDGRSAWIDARSAVMFGNPGTRPVSMTGIVLDITERKNRQMRLDRNAADLDVANRLKDEFMAALACKLRHPLTPIRNGLDTPALTGFEDPTQWRACELMGRPLRHLVHLVDELLDASLVSRGTLSLSRERVALQSLVRRAIDLVREQLDVSPHELKLELTNKPLLLDADPLRIAQAIANVVENAIRHTPEGGRIIVRMGTDERGATIQVLDSGAGIPPLLLPHVFDLFGTQRTPDRAHANGLEIGLALAHAVVKMHGGSMNVARGGLGGSGSAFRIWLPIARVPVSALSQN